MTDPDARSVLASYLVVLAVPIGLWTLANPLAGGAAIAAAAAASVAARRLLAVTRRLPRRRTVPVRVGEALCVSVRAARPDESPPPERCCA